MFFCLLIMLLFSDAEKLVHVDLFLPDHVCVSQLSSDERISLIYFMFLFLIDDVFPSPPQLILQTTSADWTVSLDISFSELLFKILVELIVF